MEAVPGSVGSADEAAGRDRSEPGEPDKRVSWAELFFDRVFVFAITQASLLLKGEHSAAGLLRALIVFVLVHWTWMGTAGETNLRDTARPSPSTSRRTPYATRSPPRRSSSTSLAWH